jgi:threonine/homoserine/homoserine lactone efflux protein
MTEFLTVGVILGLSAGISPGPLLALVISETLRHGMRAGVHVALSPLVTDLPIIVLTFFMLSTLSDVHGLLGIIALIGGCVIFYMGFESMRPAPPDPGAADAAPRSLVKGILVNALSPHPYLFWLSVGAPIMGRAMAQGSASLVAFIASFYVLLVGSKITLAVLVGRSRSFLNGAVYKYTMRLLGLALWGLAFFLFRDGLKLLGVIGGA